MIWYQIHQSFTLIIQIDLSSIRQSFPHQNIEITNLPKFFPTRILSYMQSWGRYFKKVTSY